MSIEAMKQALELLAVATLHSPELQAKRTEVIEKGLRAIAEAEFDKYDEVYMAYGLPKSEHSEPVPHHPKPSLDAGSQGNSGDLPTTSKQEPVAWKETRGKVIKALAGIVTVHTPDNLFDLDAIPRDPVMLLVQDIYAALDKYKPRQLKQEPVAAQCKFDTEKTWEPCSIEHHNLVQSEPHKWPQYQTRLLYTDPQPKRESLWIDPNDKTQAKFLPNIGEPILFCHDGKVYYGQHNGGSFQCGYGVTTRYYTTWGSRWMYLPAPQGTKDIK